MASGSNHQPWGYAHFQPGQDPNQSGNFVNQTFGHGDGDISSNAFAMPQQWQTQDTQFVQDNNYSNFQPQGSDYSMQHFPANNSHVQSQQHPQSYNAPLSMDGSPEIPWDYAFDFGTNSMATIGDGGISYGDGLQQGPNNSLPTTSSFPQDIPNNVPGPQQQFSANPSSGDIYAPNQAVSYGRNTQQSPPQTVSQPMPNQRQVMDYQQPAVHHHQHQPQSAAQSAIHRQPPQQQPQSVISQHKQPSLLQQQQQQQQQQPVINQHQHQQHNPLQAGGQQPNPLRNVNHLQQMSRTGTPQSQSVTPTTQLRQSPFNGRNVPPLSMPQPVQDARGNSVTPFPVHQEPNVQGNVLKASPSLSNAQTTQSRLLPQQLVSVQRQSQSPLPTTNSSVMGNAVPRTQSQIVQPTTLGSVQQDFQPHHQPNIQPKTNIPIASASASQPLDEIGLGIPQVIRRDDNAFPHYGSRYVGFSPAPAVYIGDEAGAKATLGEIYDPDELPGDSFHYGMPLGSRIRYNADSILYSWVKALKEGDVAGQNELEQHLTRHLGGFLPEIYVAKMQEARAAKKKASAQQGPERSKIRPTEEADAAEWDALGIVYLTNPQPTSAEIGVAVAAFGKLIRTHAGEFQKLKQKVKTAKEADIPALKDHITRKLDVIHRVVTAANEWGDPQVVANLGGNQKLISDFVSCLIHANNSGDHNGKVPKDVLRLMSAITTIEKDFLMTSLQFAKISKKFESKGDEEVKDFVKRIKDNADSRRETLKAAGAEDERTSTPDSGTGYRGTSATSSMDSKAPLSVDTAKKKAVALTMSRVPSTSSTASSTTKRPREEEADTKAVKRVATDPVSSQVVQKAAPAKVVVPAPNTASAQSKIFGSGILGAKKPPVKPLTRTLPAKADGVKTETKQDIKKEAIRRVEAARIKKTEPVKAEAPSASKLGGISALLDSISNAKPKPTGRSTPDKDAKSDREETPDEKARRLRKEKRRHLRVTWKEGDELTEVREFQKDAEEDEGRAGNMIRDAHDDRSEGMMLKQGLMSGVQDEEEDEDDDLPYRPWEQPAGIDFDSIPQETRAKSFVNRGGLEKIETQQQKLIAERENKELMVVYTDPSDIPPTPKSPHPQPSQDTDMHAGIVYNLGQDDPKLAEIHLRWAEASSRGLSWARLNALRRAQKGQSTSLSDIANMNASTPAAYHAPSHALPAQPLSCDEQVVALLTSDRVKNWKDPDPVDPAHPKTQRRYDNPDPTVQRAADMIEEVAEQLRGKPFPSTEPPEWMKQDKAKVAEWWHGYNKDKQRAEQRAQQQQIVMQAAQSEVAVQPQAQAAPQVAQAAADPNAAAWAAYYAQLQQQQQQQVQPQAAPQAAQNMTDPNAAAWAAYYAQLQQQQQQQVQPQAAPQAAQNMTDPNAAAWAAYYHQQQQAAAPTQPTAGDSNAQLQAVLAALGGTPAQTQQPAAAVQSSTDPQLQALLASLGATPTTAQQSAQSYQAQPAQLHAPNPNDPNYMAYIISLAADQTPDHGQAQTHQQPANNVHRRDESRDRGRDPDRELEAVHPSRRAATRGSKNNRDNSGSHQRGINRDKIGTKPCVFWAKGLCQKGEQCTFRHD